MKLKDYLLDLKEKIIKHQENYYYKNEKKEKVIEQNSEEINKLLENSIKDFFPKKGNWKSTCFSKPKEHNMNNLPCHLRDEHWLAKMIQIKENLYYISIEKIIYFINNSTLFNELRHNYELEIVKWQIDWMRNDGENWIVDDNLGGDEYEWSNNCDIAFRKGILNTLTEIGMNYEVIEEGIEKNSDMWRDRFMSLAFDNEFNEDILFYDIEKAEQEHKEKWLKMRRFQYYNKHKKSIERYGTILPEMKMTYEEAAELQMYLIRKKEERKEYLKKIKKDPTKRKQLKLF